jgi:hypothetical protein
MVDSRTDLEKATAQVAGLERFLRARLLNTMTAYFSFWCSSEGSLVSQHRTFWRRHQSASWWPRRSQLGLSSATSSSFVVFTPTPCSQYPNSTRSARSRMLDSLTRLSPREVCRETMNLVIPTLPRPTPTPPCAILTSSIRNLATE